MTLPQPRFLPVSREEADELGIDRFDIILVTGDAYLDHPALATALLGRRLWDEGYTVGIIPQPDPQDPASVSHLGAPRLFFSVSGGAMDSMVAHYTPAMRIRSEDANSPGGRRIRPDRATLVYADLVHRLHPRIPLVIGGVEASLRRFAHYDYWSDRIRQSILADAPADLLVYGMGEQQLIRIASRISRGEEIRRIRDIAGTCWKIQPKEWRASPALQDQIDEIPSYVRVVEDPGAFARAHAMILGQQNPYQGRPLIQQHPKTGIVQNPPALPLSSREMDRIYDLPYQREAHPSYQEPVPALEPIRSSVTSHRGCYGNCSFCALTMHQGRIIQSRSPESILREVRGLTEKPGFSGVITDVGGPSANMYGDWCSRWEREGPCPDRECSTCSRLRRGLPGYLSLLECAGAIRGITRVFIGSGVRYDLIPEDTETMRRMAAHVSGQLKVAPEHISQRVTGLMNKPGKEIFENFRCLFTRVSGEGRSRLFLVPYLMSGHPGCTMTDMVELAEYLRDTRLYTEQVQDFTPTPMTGSTCMYATGIDPRTMKPVSVPKGEEKAMQRTLLHWREPANHARVYQALVMAGREDLIGDGPLCLIRRRGPVPGIPGRDPRPQGGKRVRRPERMPGSGKGRNA